MEEDIGDYMKEDIEEKDMTPILLKDLGMEYPTEKSMQKKRFGIFQCQYCGKEFTTQLANVKNGHTKSCGCQIKGREITHGLSNHRFYNKWMAMMSRCYSKKAISYPNYGGRGITVHKEWQDVRNFVKWADETYIDGMTLDRIDNDKGYYPNNCRWADAYTQNINQRKKRNNTSGYVGVKWHKNKRENKWSASINIKNKYTYLGYFKDKMDAVKARDDYIKEHNLPHKLSTDY